MNDIANSPHKKTVKISERINLISAEIMPCETLADIGCDHGYITFKALENNLCKKAIITDISQNSLKKAEILLKDYIEAGRVKAYCTDGLSGIDDFVDTAVIAGMGGMEILSALKTAKTLPERLILQPMKNSRQVRETLQAQYEFIKDYLFYCGDKFYNVLVLRRGRDSLTPLEAEYGRTNLIKPSQDFITFINTEINKIKLYIENTKDKSNKQLNKRLEELQVLQTKIGGLYDC